ncbi:hypothetical protein GW17_00046718 [Ensete ventricosum]|nr:hypothetical protein GW17_00046718 [Ensete ventricosum]
MKEWPATKHQRRTLREKKGEEERLCEEERPWEKRQEIGRSRCERSQTRDGTTTVSVPFMQAESCGASQCFHVMNAISVTFRIRVQARHKPNPLWCNPSPRSHDPRERERVGPDTEPLVGLRVCRFAAAGRTASRLLCCRCVYGHLYSSQPPRVSHASPSRQRRVTESECCGYKNEKMPSSRRRCTGNSTSLSFPPCPFCVFFLSASSPTPPNRTTLVVLVMYSRCLPKIDEDES